jgi:N-acetyl-anhydromuramoyl-L-alanine amidase
MEIKNHLLLQARQLESPNYGERPAGEEITLLVIHNISLPPGEYAGPYIDDLFLNRLDCSLHPYFARLKDMRVSSHLLINRAGEITQYVPFNLKAHHAGESSFEGRTQCNDFSIGIELEGCDEEAFTQAQYDKLATLTGYLLVAYPGITPDRIVGHSDIAPDRKTDPGPCFDWGLFRSLLENE